MAVLSQDGAIQGGDSDIFYVGTYKAEGDRLSGEFRTGKHSQGPGTSLFGRNSVRVKFEGRRSADGKSATVQGTSPDAPGLTFNAILTRLSD